MPILPAGNELSWGSAAVAAAGGFTVEVDEALSGDAAWQLTIEAPAVYVSLRLDGSNGIAEIVRLRDFLQPPSAGAASAVEFTVVGRAPGCAVKLVRDNETGGRFFVRATLAADDEPSAAAAEVRLTLTPEHASAVVTALTEVIEQLHG